MPVEGCYVSAVYQGSSADTVLPPGILITEVDETPTPTLDALSRIVQGKPDGARLRVKVLTPKGKVCFV
jgi:S1-C subfamily serine protease